MAETKTPSEQPRRVLARILADDLRNVTGGMAQQCTSTVTGDPNGNLNGSDITNVGCDGD
jgi:hypothetical protein